MGVQIARYGLGTGVDVLVAGGRVRHFPRVSHVLAVLARMAMASSCRNCLSGLLPLATTL